ncbi:MAG: nucleotidyltransferase family protein [Terracidiphilus sp.]
MQAMHGVLDLARTVWQCSHMDRGSIIRMLQKSETELRAERVAHLILFGSVARGDQSEQSDIDIMAEFEPSKRRTLITMVRLENRLSDLLGVRVDLSLTQTMKDRVRARAMREAIHAF